MRANPAILSVQPYPTEQQLKPHAIGNPKEPGPQRGAKNPCAAMRQLEQGSNQKGIET